MKKFLLALFIFFVTCAYSEAMSLRSSFLHLPEGAYFVLKNKNIYTLFHLIKKNQEDLHIEEMSIEKHTFQNKKMSWSAWLEEEGKELSSHLIYTMNKQTGKIASVYLVDEEQWADTDSLNPLFHTLINLPFEKIPDAKRKRIAGARESDQRAFWTPKVVYEGKEIKNTQFNEWESYWPDDQTELSGVYIRLYLPKEGELPLRIPYWMSFQSSAVYQIIQTVDAGIKKPHTSPIGPRFSKGPIFDDEYISFEIALPPGKDQYTLSLLPKGIASCKHAISIPYILERDISDKALLKIPIKHLLPSMKKHSATLRISNKDDCENYDEVTL